MNHSKNYTHDVKLNTSISDYNNNLASKMFSGMDTDKVFSPLSIAFALSLLHIGARENTDAELCKLFGGEYDISDLEAIHHIFNNDVVKMTNCLAINHHLDVNEHYLALLKNIALITKEDFSNCEFVKDKLNEFIKMNTNGLIQNVITSLDPNTFAVLINTIYFKANWEYTFSKSMTSDALFTNSTGIESTVATAVKLMTLEKRLPYFEDSQIQMIEMPYVGNQFCMGVVLPKAPSGFQSLFDGFMSNFTKKQNFFESFDVNKINEYVKQLTTNENIKVYIPKFTHRKNIDLGSVLKKVGVVDLFSPSANLGEISKDLYVSEAIHEAVVIVDEDGTEASAVTVMMMLESCCMKPKQPKLFRADHSFIYYIRHKPTNMILFVGDYHGV